MSGFIRKAACRGHCPTIFRSYRYYERPELTARLLQERSRCALLSRLTDMAKVRWRSTAHMEFGYQTASYWVNGEARASCVTWTPKRWSMIFIAGEETASLVVFDDVPPLDVARTELFSAQVDQLLFESGSEVAMVTLVPLRCLRAPAARPDAARCRRSAAQRRKRLQRTFGSGVASPEVRQRENKDRVPGSRGRRPTVYNVSALKRFRRRFQPTCACDGLHARARRRHFCRA